MLDSRVRPNSQNLIWHKGRKGEKTGQRPEDQKMEPQMDGDSAASLKFSVFSVQQSSARGREIATSGIAVRRTGPVR